MIEKELLEIEKHDAECAFCQALGYARKKKTRHEKK